MTVLLVLITFLVFISIDWWMHRSEVPVAAPVPVEPAYTADYVDGFHIPANLTYHPGHAWVARERKNVFRVGVDEFAAFLAGRIDAIELPKPGQWVRQGQRAWTLLRKGQQSGMVSPIEGEVVEINPLVAKDPTILRRDPYQAGWLMTLHVPDEESTARNMVPGGLLRAWIHEAVERLYSRQGDLVGAVAAEGGRPVDDLAAALPGEDWAKLTGEFFLTES